LHRHPSLDDRFDPPVRIVDYDPAWPAVADADGLAAKPIVDLQLSVDAIEPRERESPDYHFFAKPPERPRWARGGAAG